MDQSENAATYPAVPDIPPLQETVTLPYRAQPRQSAPSARCELAAALAQQYFALPAQARSAAVLTLIRADTILGGLVARRLDELQREKGKARPPAMGQGRKKAQRTDVRTEVREAVVDEKTGSLILRAVPEDVAPEHRGARRLARQSIHAWPVEMLAECDAKELRILVPVKATVRELQWSTAVPPAGMNKRLVTVCAVMTTPDGPVGVAPRSFCVARQGAVLAEYMACLGRVADPGGLVPGGEWYGFVSRS